MKHHHHHQQLITLQPKPSTRKINPSNYNFTRTTSSSSSSSSFPILPLTGDTVSKRLLISPSPATTTSAFQRFNLNSIFSSFFHSLLHVITLPNLIIPTCKWLSLPMTSLSITPSLGRKVTGTLFGNRRGNVSFAVQDDPRSEPVLILELAMSTATLVKEMSSGLVRIALECEDKRRDNPAQKKRSSSCKLFHEPAWTMYCNGRKCGNVVKRTCSEFDRHVLKTVQTVTVGAGVIPVVDDARKSCGEGELLYMRARFERVVGNRNSEAFYMLNPDGNGGAELSIFLLRL